MDTQYLREEGKKEVGQIDERGPAILALIGIIFSNPVITPTPPHWC